MKTTFSRRELYAFGEPIGDSATVKKIGGGRIYGLGGGGGGGPTTTTVQNTNVPEYARPYVETMLGATQEQLFTGSRGADVTNPETGEVTQGNFNITGFKPYQAYGGTYDAAGKQLTYDPSKAIAGFSPAQIAAQQGIAGQYNPATGKLALGADGKPINAGLQLPSEFDDASAGIKSFIDSKSAYTAPTNLGYTSSDAASQGYTSSDAAAFAANAAKLGSSPEALAAKSAYAPTLQQYQMGGPDKVATRSFTDKGTAESFMSPYRANVLDIQNKELERQAGIASNARGAQAAKAGAFGGSRQGIENAEANRNLAMMKNANTAQGMQQSYEQAMQQFNAEQGYGLQGQIANQQAGLTVGQQNLGANLGVQQLGTETGKQIALANLSNEQQTALANQALKGQYGLTQGQFDQGANMQTSAQAQQAAMANAAAKSAASQFGAAAGNQASLANAAAKNAAAQFTSGQNLASAQTAAQYGLAADQLGLQASSQLGALGGQELAARQGILGLQNTVGAQQQQQEQQIKNQAIQDYSNAQQYPLMQLGTMSNMLRGLPMQASSTQQYQAQPSQLSQAIGTIGAGASIANAFKAEGGVIKGYAGGGIMSYDMGGEVESQLESMDEQGLAEQAKESSSPSIRKMAQRILRERQMSRPPQGTGPMGVQYQAAQPQMPAMRGGGIIAFARPTDANNQSLVMDPEKGEGDATGLDPMGRTMEERLAMPPVGGVMDVAAPPPVAAAPVSKVNLAMQQDAAIPPFLKAQYNEAERREKMTGAQHIAETEGLYAAAGVGGQSEGQRKQREEMMAEKANMGEEKERQKYLRMAEFFAKWGSTPGPTLVAGLNALKESVPGIISDAKEQKKANREIDKSIADIDNAVRLEKRGEIDKGQALRLKAAEDMKALQKTIADYKMQADKNAADTARSEASDESRSKASAYSADSQLEAARMRVGSDAAYRSSEQARKEQDATFGRYNAANKEYGDVLAEVTKQESQDAHKNDLKKLEQYTMGAKDKKTGEIDPNKINKEYKALYAETLKRVNDRKEGWETAIKDAKIEKDLAFSRVKGLSPEAIAAKKGGKDVPTAAPSIGSVSGEFGAPTAAHISALKANPTQKAAFDAKFGPGAADEYLRK